MHICTHIQNLDDTTDELSILSLNTVGVASKRLWAAVVGCYIFTFVALYYLSKVYLAVAYATDQFLIGSTTLLQIDKLSWFNYKQMIDQIVEVNVKVARAPIDFGGDMLSKVKGYVVKQQHAHHHENEEDEEEDEEEQKEEHHDDDEKIELLRLYTRSYRIIQIMFLIKVTVNTIPKLFKLSRRVSPPLTVTPL